VDAFTVPEQLVEEAQEACGDFWFGLRGIVNLSSNHLIKSMAGAEDSDAGDHVR
jgi:hypothetical protein